MAARGRAVSAAAARVRTGPQETKEWGEGAWWRYDSRTPPPHIIPGRRRGGRNGGENEVGARQMEGKGGGGGGRGQGRGRGKGKGRGRGGG